MCVPPLLHSVMEGRGPASRAGVKRKDDRQVEVKRQMMYKEAVADNVTGKRGIDCTQRNDSAQVEQR